VENWWLGLRQCVAEPWGDAERAGVPALPAAMAASPAAMVAAPATGAHPPHVVDAAGALSWPCRRGGCIFTKKVITKTQPHSSTTAQPTPALPPTGRTIATTALPRNVAPPAAVVYMAMAAPVCRGAIAGMIAPSGTKPASRMPKVMPAAKATQ